MTYRESLILVSKQLSLLQSKHGVFPGKESWVNEAIRLIEDLIVAGEEGIPQNEYFKKTEFLYDRTITSIAELINLREILDSLNKIDKKNLDIFLKKLKVIFNAPLLIKNETTNSSEGRNTMFELRIFSRFVDKDYDASLSSNHPDISVKANGNAYSIECKRIFKKETLITNAKAAIEQLLKYSLNKPGYGIVALSISRYFNDAGNTRLEAISEEAAKVRIEHEMDSVLSDYRDELLDLFPFKIPAIFLEFSDRVVADKAYSMNLIDIIETANGRPSLFYKVRKDLNSLFNTKMEK